MYSGKWVVASALLGVFAVAAAWAQDVRSTATVRRAVSDIASYDNYDNYDSYDYYAPEKKEAAKSPSAAPAKEKAPAASAPSCVSCDDECGWTACNSGWCGGGCGSAEPWTLPQLCVLQSMGIKMGGWLEQGVTLNSTNPADGFNGPVATNDLDGEYQMNQLWLYFDRPADNGGCGWAIGGHVDMLYGTDWRFGINNGLENRINSIGDQTYGMVIPQMYLEAAYNNLSVKFGHFAGILDYEAVPAVLNPFYSHSYSYGYTVPQLVTGALADYKLTDQFSIQAGFHRGWMMFEDLNDNLDFMGGVKWQSVDKGTSLAWAMSAGPQDPPFESDGIPGNQDRFVYSFVMQRQMTERLKYVFVHNLGTEDNATPTGQDGEWYGLNQYFLYKINPALSANMRLEWLRDDDGVVIGGPASVIPPLRTWDGRGYAGDFYNVTCGLNWRPCPNLLFRPELRWDWYDGLTSRVTPNKPLPFGGGDSDEQLTFGVDAIFTY